MKSITKVLAATAAACIALPLLFAAASPSLAKPMMDGKMKHGKMMHDKMMHGKMMHSKMMGGKMMMKPHKMSGKPTM